MDPLHPWQVVRVPDRNRKKPRPDQTGRGFMALRLPCGTGRTPEPAGATSHIRGFGGRGGGTGHGCTGPRRPFPGGVRRISACGWWAKVFTELRRRKLVRTEFGMGSFMTDQDERG
ncbi:hypothetical protein GCM10010195_06780 [Kitasatospora griseola]|nr:hypothetical protein GCM10010195_06780 [Kitasatospora griseola]